MTTVDEGLFSFLLVELAAYVGVNVSAIAIQQGAALPAVTITRIDTPRELTHDTMGAGGDLTHARFQIDVWSDTYAGANSICTAIRAALNGKTGLLTAGVSINSALVVDERPSYDPDTKVHRISCDYVIWNVE